jgi:hypothetical protein
MPYTTTAGLGTEVLSISLRPPSLGTLTFFVLLPLKRHTTTPGAYLIPLIPTLTLRTKCSANALIRMYAFRPISNPVSSDSLSADLTQHSTYGKFTLDMIQATGLGGVPVAVSSMSGVTLTGNQFIEDGDDASITHGYSVAALLLFFTPLLMLHLISGVRLRWLNYLIFIIVLLIRLAAGFFDSTYYNRVLSNVHPPFQNWNLSRLLRQSKNFNTPHQIIGYVLLAGLLFICLFRRVIHRESWSDNQSH